MALIQINFVSECAEVLSLLRYGGRPVLTFAGDNATIKAVLRGVIAVFG